VDSCIKRCILYQKNKSKLLNIQMQSNRHKPMQTHKYQNIYISKCSKEGQKKQKYFLLLSARIFFNLHAFVDVLLHTNVNRAAIVIM
jgi:hypothetical protein